MTFERQGSMFLEKILWPGPRRGFYTALILFSIITRLVRGHIPINVSIHGHHIHHYEYFLVFLVVTFYLLLQFCWNDRARNFLAFCGGICIAGIFDEFEMWWLVTNQNGGKFGGFIFLACLAGLDGGIRLLVKIVQKRRSKS